MSLNLAKYGLGVMNITPNSFSDPGLNLDEANFKINLQKFLANGFESLDFGAESTAPKNAGLVSPEEEWARISKYIIPKLALYDDEFSKLRFFSLDTYRLETFVKFEKIFRNSFPHTVLVWNDISGVVDLDLQNFLIEFGADIKLNRIKYVANFTFVKNRDQSSFSSFHTDYQQLDIDIVNEFLKRESEFLQLFSKYDLENGLIYDPGFGFSKSYEQNLQLLNYCLEQYQPRVKGLLFGLSRKSFLREKIKEINPALNTGTFEELVFQSESLHKKYLKGLCRRYLGQKNLGLFWLRVHDPFIFNDLPAV